MSNDAYLVAYLIDYDAPGDNAVLFQLNRPVTAGNGKKCLFISPQYNNQQSAEIAVMLTDAFRGGRQISITPGHNTRSVLFKGITENSVGLNRLYVPFQ